MTLEERCNLVLAFARVLYVNGQATDQTLDAAERLANTLGLRAQVMPRWGELQLQAEDTDARLISAVTADPAGVDMDLVASTLRAIEEIGTGGVFPCSAKEAMTQLFTTATHSTTRTRTAA